MSAPTPRWRAVAAVIAMIAATLCLGAAVDESAEDTASIASTADGMGSPPTTSPAGVAIPAAVRMPAAVETIRRQGRRPASEAFTPEPLAVAPKTSPPRAA